MTTSARTVLSVNCLLLQPPIRHWSRTKLADFHISERTMDVVAYLAPYVVWFWLDDGATNEVCGTITLNSKSGVNSIEQVFHWAWCKEVKIFLKYKSVQVSKGGLTPIIVISLNFGCRIAAKLYIAMTWNCVLIESTYVSLPLLLYMSGKHLQH